MIQIAVGRACGTFKRTTAWARYRPVTLSWHVSPVLQRDYSTPSDTLPLVRLDRAVLSNLHSDSPSLSLTIPNSSEELWAVIEPASSASGAGAKVLATLTSILAGRTRPQQQQEDGPSLSGHPTVHPFARHDSTKVGLALFNKQQAAASTSEFQDFSKRYGAFREEDLITLFEQIMFDQGFEVGRVARLRIVADKLSEREKATEADAGVFDEAGRVQRHVETIAPLLGLDKPVPGTGPDGPRLLHQPTISLSNGQTRRASICGALVGLARRGHDQGPSSTASSTTLLVLVQPFSGLDEPSRDELAAVLTSLHQQGSPRVVLVLRRQDELPHGVTHVVDVDETGKVWVGSRDEWRGSKVERPKGVAGIRQNKANGIGVGKGNEDIAKIENISVRYGTTTVLDQVSLTLRPGSRMVIKGANGSGKTTLLALLNGTHPQSYSFDDNEFVLFGRPRASPSNATRLLNKRIGYFGPDLLAAFPRRGLDMGGLTVEGAIASGFEGVYSRVSLTQERRQRVRDTLSLFVDCIALRDERRPVGARSQQIQSPEDKADDLLKRPFIALNIGSQAVVLFLRAIINQPELLILDEPFQGMDSSQIDRIRQYIDASSTTASGQDDPFALGSTQEEKLAHAQQRRQSAVVLVSHYVNEWPDTMGEYILLDAGKTVERV